MKIYVQDHGVYGVIIVTANNLQEATKKITETFDGYYKDRPIQEFELEGFEYQNEGDR